MRGGDQHRARRWVRPAVRRPWGVRGRVVAAAVATLAVGVAVLTVAANLLLANQLDQDANGTLSDRAAAQQATLTVRHGHVTVLEGPRDKLLDQRAWVFVNGRALERPDVSPAVQRVAASLAHVRAPVRREAGDLRLLGEPILSRGGRIQGAVVVALSRVPYEHTGRIVLLGSIALSLFLLLASGAIAWLATGAALRPVADMTARAGEWSEHDLHRRFDLGPPHDELTGLAATLDGLLARIEGALRHEQRFSAEVAHELRTPLAGLRAEAEFALRESASAGGQREALERIVAISERMESVIDALLTIGRQEVDPAVASSDPERAARAAVEACEPTAAARGVTIRVVGQREGPSAAAPAEVIARALHPLVENAVRHARSEVRVAAVPDHGAVVVRVEDDGAGVRPDQLDAIFDPGVRSSGSNGDGAGLGLPLARRLARSCGGEVSAEPGPGGRFALRLPAVG
jgi:signal transduction histidine kinase